jgi:hypothetical protein
MRPKELLSMAGEMATASELLQRGVIAQVLVTPYKRTDLLTDKGLVEVKTKQGPEWINIKGPPPNGIIIFVDFHSKALGERPTFYILTQKDWQLVVHNAIELPNNGGLHVDPDGVARYADGWIINVSPGELTAYVERWEKICA